MSNQHFGSSTNPMQYCTDVKKIGRLLFCTTMSPAKGKSNDALKLYQICCTEYTPKIYRSTPSMQE
jgi:hypothetical protein